MPQRPKSNKKPMHVKRGDTVMVISGKDKGKTGVIAQVFVDKYKVLIEGLNQAKKSVKPNPMLGIEGGLQLIDRPMHVSKVMLYSVTASKPTRVKMLIKKTPDGKVSRLRVCKHTGTELD